MSTYYATLELPTNAPPAAIRQAYRRLVLLTHPDRTPDPAAHQRFLAVNEAYDVLRDPARRAAYDAGLRRAATPPPASPNQPPPQRPDPRRPRYSPRKPSASTPRGPRRTSFDLRPYARAIRWVGRGLLAFGLLVLLDFFLLNYTTPARCLALDVASPNSITTLVTTQGRIATYGRLPDNILTVPLRVRRSLIFRFVRAVSLPSGQALQVQRTGTSTPGFVGFMLLLALLSQWPRLSLGMRLNVLMLAGVTAILVLLMLGR